ncbi:hypothetical protein HWV07_07095 [Natronomonas salina]|uniref:PKD domain-containing protein n=1 Tax=Natronomonas salina TaxID=1710540 RepID=UPI0015B46B5E|nr:PKD domain-containing protein [Natronomonas salina]QLD88811.1 hypothetical protein HWV07_07095 [Natronomonas salina]
MRPRLFAVIILIVAATLAVPTVAMTTSGSDQIDSAVELAPHDGPNGKYATVEDGELRVDFDRLNKDAVTRAHNVFEITSTADEPIEVWVEADVGGSVTAYESDDPKADLEQGDWRELQPGETLSVGFSIHTYGEAPDSGTVSIGVRSADEDSSSGGSGEEEDTPDWEAGNGESTDDGGTPTPAPAPGDSEVQNRTAGVEVVFEGEGDYANTTVRELGSLPEDGPATTPRATIDPGRLDATVEDDGLEVHGTEFVAQQHEPIRLTGTQSYVSTADSITTQHRPATIVEITPPRELRESPALVRIRVDRDAFPATNSVDTRIGRHTAEGWQLLPTRVIEETDDTVLLEARTQGFSVFTVLAESDVTYEWTLPDGHTVVDDNIRTSFVEAGTRNVTLTVTDAFGRSDDATQEILVNDPPSVAIDQSRNETDGDLTMLRANVTNEYGNATVTWTLPDGSTATGETVTGAFETGETVGVTVEDDYGATATTETTIGATGPSTSGITELPLSLPAWLYVLLALTAVALVVVVARSEMVLRLGQGSRSLVTSVVDRFGADSPRITRFENPRWNPAEDRVEIGALEVTAPSGLLRAVELSVTDAEGASIVTRTIELDATGSYTASPEYIPVYGGFELSDGGSYHVEVRAIDDREQVGAVDQTQLWTTATTP